MNKFFNKKGFTFVELILVVAVIGVLSASAIMVINPAKRFKDNRNAQRTSDVNAILNSVYQYYIDNDGTLPSAIQEDADCLNPSTTVEICKTGIASLTCLADQKLPLTDLTTNEKYMVSMPIDPTGESTYGTGYNIVKSANSRITVCAPNSEDTTISVTR